MRAVREPNPNRREALEQEYTRLKKPGAERDSAFEAIACLVSGCAEHIAALSLPFIPSRPTGMPMKTK